MIFCIGERRCLHHHHHHYLCRTVSPWSSLKTRSLLRGGEEAGVAPRFPFPHLWPGSQSPPLLLNIEPPWSDEDVTVGDSYALVDHLWWLSRYYGGVGRGRVSEVDNEGLPDVRHLLWVQLLPFQINWQSLKVSSFFLILSTRSATSTPEEHPLWPKAKLYLQSQLKSYGFANKIAKGTKHPCIEYFDPKLSALKLSQQP